MSEHSSEHSSMTITSSSENEKLQGVVVKTLLCKSAGKNAGKSYAMSAQEICDYRAQTAGSSRALAQWSSCRRAVDVEMECWRMVESGALVRGTELAGRTVFAVAGAELHPEACFAEFE